MTPRARRRGCAAGCGPLLLVLFAAALVVGLWRPANVAWRTALLLPEVFPDPPLRPLALLAPEPVRETVAFSEHVPDAAADLYYPADGERHGAVILLLGARPFPKDAPQLVELATGLARDGVAVMIIETPNLAVGRIVPEEIVPIADAYRYAARQPRIDPARVGYIALSVGGSLLLLALARDHEFGDALAFANVFGAYYDAEAMLRTMATDTMTYRGESAAWEPAPLARQIFAGALIDALPEDPARDALWQYYVVGDEAAKPEVDALTSDAAALRDLLAVPSPEKVEPLIGRLPAAIRERLVALSPSHVLADVRTPLFVMHDRGDHFVPYVESRQIVDHLPPGVLRRYTEFELFDHVNPTRSLDPISFAREVAALYWQLYDMLQMVM